MTNWMQSDIEGRRAWTGGTDELSVTVVPELGAKAVSLLNRKTGREWLWSSGKPLGNRGFGSAFGDSDECGWDEMFPGIRACEYPEDPWRGEPVPDHGEAWTLAWSAAADERGLTCAVNGKRFPYALEKRYSFPDAHTLRIDYTAINHSAHPFSFLWAAHPLMRASEGMRLRVPDGLNEIEVAYSAQERLGGFGDKRPWPVAAQGIDLSVIEPDNGRSAEKYYFTGTLKEGWAELSDPSTGEAVEFRFPAEQVPYLAVWANYGGYDDHYHIAIEPATGRMDDLSYAMGRGEAATIAPGGRYAWHLELSVR
ncbi:DUF4432 family protein [Paenibacillus glycinis]|uniref:DUF4432 family protein n=1 Tax=Paenibacillus glycinis TaxID=2697035 RepID=A0ABW9XNM1_9BACL|nr:DUF4432 family protein [Paenibacillus glycinis]NBD24232.1 DUF4432 family protein [Paenibacillus glycinis]